MSVSNPVIDYIDPDLRRIFLAAGVTAYHTVDDIYMEVRNLRRTDESLRGWDLFAEAGGNVQKTAFTFTPRYLVLLTDDRDITTKIVPDVTASHSLKINGEQISDKGTSGSDLIDKSLLAVGINVDVTVQPAGAEIIRLDQDLIEFSSFQGVVVVDTLNGVVGVGKTSDGKIIGTREAPSNNWNDAVNILHGIGLTTFVIAASTSINSPSILHGHKFVGDGANKVTVHLGEAPEFTQATFEDMILSGYADGNNMFERCFVTGLETVSGFFKECAFVGVTNLTGNTNIFDCYSGVVGLGSSTFNVGSTEVLIRNWRGSITLSGAIEGHISSVGVSGGRVIIEDTCVGGEIHLRGEPFEIVDNRIDKSGDGCKIFDETTSNSATALLSDDDLLRIADNIPTSEIYSVFEMSVIKTTSSIVSSPQNVVSTTIDNELIISTVPEVFTSMGVDKTLTMSTDRC